MILQTFLNFKISYFGPMNFELLSIRTLPLILAVTNTKNDQNIPTFSSFFKIKKKVLEVKILYKSQGYKHHVMFKIWWKGPHWEKLKVQRSKVRDFKV